MLRACSTCCAEKPRELYSKTQWKVGGRCAPCVALNPLAVDAAGGGGGGGAPLPSVGLPSLGDLGRIRALVSAGAVLSAAEASWVVGVLEGAPSAPPAAALAIAACEALAHRGRHLPHALCKRAAARAVAVARDGEPSLVAAALELIFRLAGGGGGIFCLAG